MDARGVGLSDVSIIDERAGAAAFRSRSARRDAFDAGIERELRRGELQGMVLPRALWDMLNTVVERELQQPSPVTEESLYAATPFSGTFRGARFRRRLEWLVQRGFVRREGDTVRPTVAGLAAVRPFSALPGVHRPPLDLLRALRRGEEG